MRAEDLDIGQAFTGLRQGKTRKHVFLMDGRRLKSDIGYFVLRLTGFVAADQPCPNSPTRHKASEANYG